VTTRDGRAGSVAVSGEVCRGKGDGKYTRLVMAMSLCLFFPSGPGEDAFIESRPQGNFAAMLPLLLDCLMGSATQKIIFVYGVYPSFSMGPLLLVLHQCRLVRYG